MSAFLPQDSADRRPHGRDGFPQNLKQSVSKDQGGATLLPPIEN